ncbi:DUF6262 family protein [Frigoribacterium sp. UYMn621]|uniref:DUF6262 family protein n=1 Tax=Frigoribacterium sp. UYMn621 TaxID=3156343 RepID=UPI003395F180
MRMSEHLTAAAQERSKRCLVAVRAAVRDLESEGSRLSLKTVAQRAGVSRNFIYSNTAALHLVSTARAAFTAATPMALPQARSTGSEESIRMRLAAALLEAKKVREENNDLRRQNAALLQEVIDLQNPRRPENVLPLRKTRF